MTDALRTAERVVRRARLRLETVRATRLGVRGLLVGTIVTLAAVGGAALVAGAVPQLSPWAVVWPLAAGLAAAGAVVVRPQSMETAALRLDARAQTDEAFLSALTARDAREEFRALSASYALARCPPESLGRVVPVEPPAATPAAVVAFALLVAVIALGGPAEAPRPPQASSAPEVVTTGGGSTSSAATPVDRVAALAALLASDAADASATRATQHAVGDLAAVGAEELTLLAEALAEYAGRLASESDSSAAAEAARAALASLDAGDVSAAAATLAKSLAPLGGRGAQGPHGKGQMTASPGAVDEAAEQAASEAPGTAGRTWSLCYDRRVRRWFQAPVMSGGGAHGGPR